MIGESYYFGFGFLQHSSENCCTVATFTLVNKNLNLPTLFAVDFSASCTLGLRGTKSLPSSTTNIIIKKKICCHWKIAFIKECC